MYLDHQPVIAAWARARPENLARVTQFCVASARVRFYNVPATMEEADAGETGALFAWKAEAWYAAERDAREVFENCEAMAEAFPGRRERGAHLVRYLATRPGLNLAKAGFVAQLAYGCAGCLDTVNQRRLGLGAGLFNGNSRYRMKHQATPAARLRLGRWYVATCERLGGPGRLWDDWCAEMHRLYPVPFKTPAAASAWHLECLGIA